MSAEAKVTELLCREIYMLPGQVAPYRVRLDAGSGTIETLIRGLRDPSPPRSHAVPTQD